MKRISLIACAIAFGVMAAAPAKADVDIIRWNGSHWCQILGQRRGQQAVAGGLRRRGRRVRHLGGRLGCAQHAGRRAEVRLVSERRGRADGRITLHGNAWRRWPPSHEAISMRSGASACGASSAALVRGHQRRVVGDGGCGDEAIGGIAVQVLQFDRQHGDVAGQRKLANAGRTESRCVCSVGVIDRFQPPLGRQHGDFPEAHRADDKSIFGKGLLRQGSTLFAKRCRRRR